MINKEANASKENGINNNIQRKTLASNRILLQQILPKEFFQGRARSNSADNLTHDNKVITQATEDNWKEVAYKKRFRDSPENAQFTGPKCPKSETYWLDSPITLNNRYDKLDEGNQDEKISGRN